MLLISRCYLALLSRAADLALLISRCLSRASNLAQAELKFESKHRPPGIYKLHRKAQDRNFKPTKVDLLFKYHPERVGNFKEKTNTVVLMINLLGNLT